MPFNSTQTVTNLGTTTITIPTTDVYTVKGKLQLTDTAGSSTQGPGGGTGTGAVATPLTQSQVVTTVNHNGSPVLVMPAGAQGFALYSVSCTTGDIISVVLTSSLPQDEQLNAIKMTLSITEGSN